MKKPVTSKALAKSIARATIELKAIDIKVLDLRELSSFTDFFVICSGSSGRHVQAIADRIVEDQKKIKERPIGMEGEDKGEWILIDYGSVVAHVFYPETREYYNIEKFWGDATEVSLKGC